MIFKYHKKSVVPYTSPQANRHLFNPLPPPQTMSAEPKTSTKLNAIVDSLSPLERKVIPHLNLPYEKIGEKAALDSVSLLRALRFLESKGILKLNTSIERVVDLGTNGIYYKKNNLPERALLLLLEKENHLLLEEAHKKSGLSDNEFKVSLGVLKGKALIKLSNGKISLTASKEELTKKTFEEQLLQTLPRPIATLPPEMLHAFEALKKRKDIIQIEEDKTISIDLTPEGKALAGQSLESNLLEEVTPDLIKTWTRGQRFRKYDLCAPVPAIQGSTRHFTLRARQDAKRIWLDLGFKELSGPMIDTSFWVFDALFTPQDHPAREMQDTFFLKSPPGTLPNKELVKRVAQAHTTGIAGSKGWKSSWTEKEARRVLLRTHTTSLSARALASLNPAKLPAKYFIISKVFRNETLDWSHGFEFYQAEGIVVDKNANLCHLLGYLKEFYRKMGFQKIRFRPSFFAYTEPSVEIEVFHPERKAWIELGGAGIFRPEVTTPLLGSPIPVLAWGQGFDRIIMDAYKIKDLREMYSNNLSLLKKKQVVL